MIEYRRHTVLGLSILNVMFISQKKKPIRSNGALLKNMLHITSIL